MARSPYAVDIVLPKDLAEMLSEVTSAPAPVRSTLLTLFTDSAVAASTAVTLLQGPPAVTYWITIVRDWLRRRRDSGTGEIRLKGPGGTATFAVTSDTNLEELAGVLHKALFPARPTQARDSDDLAL